MFRFHYTALNRIGVPVSGEIDAPIEPAAQQRLSELGWKVTIISDGQRIQEAFAFSQELQDKLLAKKGPSLWERIKNWFKRKPKNTAAPSQVDQELKQIDFRTVLKDKPTSLFNENEQTDQNHHPSKGQIKLDINKLEFNEVGAWQLFWRKLKSSLISFIAPLKNPKRITIEKQVVSVDRLDQSTRRHLQTDEGTMSRINSLFSHSRQSTNNNRRILVLKGFLSSNFNLLQKLYRKLANLKKLKEKNRLRKINFRKSQEQKDQQRAHELLQIQGYEKTGNIFIDTFNWLNERIVNLTPVGTKDLMTFYQLLAVMTNAGIPLLKSLKQLLNQIKNLKFRKILYVIIHEIENGSPLSVAMSNFDTVFGNAEIGMVQAGEASGQLGQVLKRVAEQTEKRIAMTSRVKNAMMYPAAVTVVLTIVGFVVMIYIVPKITEIFTQANVDLPASTQFLIATSGVMKSYWYLFIAAVAGIYFLIRTIHRTADGKYYMDYIKLKLPIFGEILKKIAVARFTRSLSTLSASGLSIIKALRINAESIGNEIYKQEIMTTAEAVKKGISISKDLDGNALFPEMVINMLAIGEETAQLGLVSGKVADFYEAEVDDTLKNLSTLIEPIIIVLIAAAVGFLVLAIMGPIMQLADVASSIQ